MSESRTFRSHRLQNCRFYFMKDPLGLLTEAQAIGIGLPRAFHCAGPSLTVAPILPTLPPYLDARLSMEDLDEGQQERRRETEEAMLAQYEKDYAAGEVKWTGD